MNYLIQNYYQVLRFLAVLSSLIKKSQKYAVFVIEDESKTIIGTIEEI